MIHNLLVIGRSAACVLLSALLFAAPAFAAEKGISQVRLTETSLKGIVGQPVEIQIEVPGEPLLSGLMYTATVNLLQYPEGAEPEILSGVPVTKMTASQTGDYRLSLRVNLVKKTSCAGASFDTVLQEEVQVRITAK